MSAVPPGWRLRIEESLPSTSDLLLRLAAASEPERLAILARRQTAGRGRDGRTWQSPAGNLYLSLLLRPEAAARDLPAWSLLGALALRDALAPTLRDPRALRLKWPNDLLLHGAKLAGILCEASAGQGEQIEWLVIGFGANLTVAPPLPDRPSACLADHGTTPAPEAVAALLLAEVDGWRRRLERDGIEPLVAAWMTHGPDPGAWLTLRGAAGETSGCYRGLDSDGALLLETNGRIRRFASGEIAA